MSKALVLLSTKFTVKLLARVVVPLPAPKLKVVAAPPILKLVALVLNKVAVALLVVKSPPLTATSPEVVMFPVAPVIDQEVALTSLAPKANAVTISASDKSIPVVIPPAAD